ncbi:hypothetical protein BDE02_11G039900 [Populus trichocarpa]|nr:hypothetical protein BDE02_11G039900 [Populus trichocarpa]
MSTFPKVKGLNGYDYYLYQGFWYAPFFLEGLLSVQERFNPQSTDIFVASCPKTGTTWLKALTFAIFTRSRLSGSTTSSLLTKMPHDCVPFWNITLLKTPVIGTWQFLWYLLMFLALVYLNLSFLLVARLFTFPGTQRMLLFLCGTFLPGCKCRKMLNLFLWKRHLSCFAMELQILDHIGTMF